jgi:hypothetical protein
MPLPQRNLVASRRPREKGWAPKSEQELNNLSLENERTMSFRINESFLLISKKPEFFRK